MSNKTYTTGRDYKSLNHITCSNYNKKSYDTSNCTKPRTNFETLDD